MAFCQRTAVVRSGVEKSLHVVRAGEFSRLRLIFRSLYAFPQSARIASDGACSAGATSFPRLSFGAPSMKVLVIGNGGREHALAWKLAQSPQVDRVFVAPGNAGTTGVAENVDISSTDIARLIKFAKQNDISLTVVGPEQPLTLGIVDAFMTEKLRVFGPTKAAAELEGSKVFCKNLLRHADVPTGDYRVFRNADSAITFLKDREDVPVVVKADGLAAGKGVIVCAGRTEALEAVDRIARKREFGSAGDQIVIEERLDGEEASVLAITDGQTIVTLPATQDQSGPTMAIPDRTREAWVRIARHRWSRTKCCRVSRSTCWCRPCTP